MHGQIRIEFIFGMIIFATIIFFIVTQFNTLISTTLSDNRINNLKAKTNSVITILIGDKGDPIDWETHISDTKRVGLANTPYDLSKSKVNSLNQSCNLLDILNLTEYRLKIYNSTNMILFCGIGTLKPATITVYRSIFVDNGFGNITLELW